MVTKVNGATYSGVWVEKRVAFIKLVFNKNISALAATDLTVLGTSTPAGVGTVASSTFGVVESALVQALKTIETKSTVLGQSSVNVLSYVSVAGATSSGTTVTVTTTAGLVVGQGVTVTAGVGAFAANTIVTSILSGTTFSVSAAPTTPLSGGASVVTATGSSVDTLVGFAEGWFADSLGTIATGLPITGAQAIVTTPGAAPTNVLGALVSVTDTAVQLSMVFSVFNGTMTVGTAANGALVLGPGSTPGSSPTNSPTGTPGYYPVSLRG